jgi:hypothetical protein
MDNEGIGNCKYVFVCGMPRTGTSVLGRNIARLENCTGLKNTGQLEDEGQFLQDVYPLAGRCGGDGRFGFDPRMHLTETSDLLTAENLARLRGSWDQFWDKNKTIRVEKTPANLLMTRFLQAGFQNSYFVIVRRHPVAVSIAIQKWKINVTSLYNLFEHWLHCHEIFEQDKKHLKRVYELRYEDYVEDPDKYHREIAAFIGTRVPDSPKEDTFRIVEQWRNPTGMRVPEHGMEATSSSHNKRYFDRWSRLLNDSPFRYYYRFIAWKYEPRFARHGYSLTRESGARDVCFSEPRKIGLAVGGLSCAIADVSALAVRLAARAKAYMKQGVKKLLPEFVADRVRRARQRSSSDKERTVLVSPRA